MMTEYVLNKQCTLDLTGFVSVSFGRRIFLTSCTTAPDRGLEQLETGITETVALNRFAYNSFSILEEQPSAV